MSSPFNNSGTPAKQDKSTVHITNSVLVCEFCFEESSEGTYHPDVKKLVWDCDDCGETNIVSDIEI